MLSFVGQPWLGHHELLQVAFAEFVHRRIIFCTLKTDPYWISSNYHMSIKQLLTKSPDPPSKKGLRIISLRG